MLNSINVATATAVCKKGTDFIPDFYGKEVEKKYWVVFEYEKEETISSIKDYRTADVAGSGRIPKWLIRKGCQYLYLHSPIQVQVLDW